MRPINVPIEDAADKTFAPCARRKFVCFAGGSKRFAMCVIELVCECLSRCLYQSDRIFSPINHLRAHTHTNKHMRVATTQRPCPLFYDPGEQIKPHICHVYK
jgi:hypothetical protein